MYNKPGIGPAGRKAAGPRRWKRVLSMIGVGDVVVEVVKGGQVSALNMSGLQ